MLPRHHVSQGSQSSYPFPDIQVVRAKNPNIRSMNLPQQQNLPKKQLCMSGKNGGSLEMLVPSLSSLQFSSLKAS